MYVDGSASDVKETEGVTNITGQYPFVLGKSYSGFEPIEIDFDDFRIYDRAINDTEVSKINEGIETLNQVDYGQED